MSWLGTILPKCLLVMGKVGAGASLETQTGGNAPCSFPEQLGAWETVNQATPPQLHFRLGDFYILSSGGCWRLRLQGPLLNSDHRLTEQWKAWFLVRPGHVPLLKFDRE